MHKAINRLLPLPSNLFLKMKNAIRIFHSPRRIIHRVLTTLLKIEPICEEIQNISDIPGSQFQWKASKSSFLSFFIEISAIILQYVRIILFPLHLIWLSELIL